MRTGLLLLAIGTFLAASGCTNAAPPGGGLDLEDDEGSTSRPPKKESPAGAATAPPAPTAPTGPAPATPPASPVTQPAFADDFARGDGALGNGWVERTAGAFRLASGAAEQFRTGAVAGLVALRPTAEDAADVEVHVDITSDTDFMDPGVFARTTVGPRGELSGYTLFLNGGGTVIIDRMSGGSFAEVARASLSRPLTIASSCRLVFRVTGSAPVKLEGTVTDAAGATLATLSATDNDAARALKGSVGFGSGEAAFTQYDNFKRFDLAP